MPENKTTYSLVIPVYNEVDSVASLHKEIIFEMDKLSEQYEIIFVNDGSNDGTEDILKKLKPVKKKTGTT